MQKVSRLSLLAVILWVGAAARAGAIVLHVPATPAVKSATAQASGVLAGVASTQPAIAGTVDGDTIHFADLLDGKPYDVTLTLADGRIIQGVNFSWFDEEQPIDPAKDPMSDDDRAQIAPFLLPGKDFFNKIELQQLAGDRNRAVALVKQIRDDGFHSDKGGEIIVRIELWYFKFEAGGWDKLTQRQRVLRRDRFPSAAAYHAAIDPIRWCAPLGGVIAGKTATEIKLNTWPDVVKAEAADSK